MSLYLRTLGGLTLHREGPEGQVVLHRSKALGVLAYLCATSGYAGRRPYLAALFWPAVDQSRALGSLRQAIYYLSKKAETTLLDADEETLAVRADRLRVDLWGFQEALAESRYREAVGLYGGPFLEGLATEGSRELSHWIQAQQDRIRVGLRAAFQRSIAEAREDGRQEEALELAERYAGLDPLDERAQTALVRTHLEAGQRIEAVQAYQRYVTLLDRELGDRPGEELERRVADLRELLFRTSVAEEAEPPEAEAEAPAAEGGAAEAATARAPEAVTGGEATGAGDAADPTGTETEEATVGGEATLEVPEPAHQVPEPAHQVPERPRRMGAMAWLAAGLVLGAGVMGLVLIAGGSPPLGSAADARTPDASEPAAVFYGPSVSGAGAIPPAGGDTAVLRLRVGGEPGALTTLGVPADGGPPVWREEPRLADPEALVSPTGEWVVRKLRGPDGLDLALEGDGGSALITSRPDDEWWGAWSPDGRYLLYGAGEQVEDGYRRRPFVYDTRSGTSRPLLPEGVPGDPGFVAHESAWSPTGLWIAFTAHVGDDAEVFVVRPDGSGLRNLSEHPARDGEPAWCPYGDELAFVSDREGTFDLYLMRPGEAAPRRLTSLSASERRPVWVNKEEIAFLMDDGAGRDVWTVDTRGEVRRRLTGQGRVRQLHDASHGPTRRWIQGVTIRPRVETVSPGQRLRLTAEVRDARGLPAAQAPLPLRWSVSDADVVRVEEDGDVRVMGEGAVEIRAELAGWRADTLRLRSLAPTLVERPVLLDEDWSGGLDSGRWAAYGEPLPETKPLTGTARPPRSASGDGAARVLVSNGDAHFQSGVISRATFPIEEGITVEYEAWTPFTGRLHEALDVELVAGPLPPPDLPEWERRVRKIASHGLSGTYRRQSIRTGEMRRDLPPPEPPDAWHAYALQLAPDGTVTLVVDGEVVWVSPQSRDLDGVDEVRLMLSGRALPAEPAHGPVRVYRGLRYVRDVQEGWGVAREVRVDR